MIPKNELHAAELYDLSLKTLETHLNLDIDGYRCDPKMALTALVKAVLDGLAKRVGDLARPAADLSVDLCHTKR